MLRVGLNPYGLTYHLGLQGRGTPRANPNARGLEGFIDIATELGARTLEIFEPWLAEHGRRRARRPARTPRGPRYDAGRQLRADRWARSTAAFRSASALGATIVRFSLTPVLCGDRGAWGERWPGLVANARAEARRYAARRRPSMA